MRKLLGSAILLVWLVSCAGLVMDRSLPAVEAGDLSLVLSLNQSVPQVGIDAVRVKVGQKIEATWIVYLPVGNGITGGEVTVYFKDKVKTYAVNGPTLEVPWKDFFEEDVWKKEYDGIAIAQAIMNYKNPEGVEETVKVRGEARVIVLDTSYDPMPPGSPFGTFKSVCTIEYSTAGRSAVKCK